MNIVLAGKVNAGKSTLFNALLMKERSIISSTPGTTRDYIQETLHMDGFSFHITDMAGIRSAAGDEIEGQGMQRSLAMIAQADAVIFMVDASLPLADRRPGDLPAAHRQKAGAAGQQKRPGNPGRLVQAASGPLSRAKPCT